MMQGIYSFFQTRDDVPVVKIGDGFIQIIASQEQLGQAAAWLNKHHNGKYMVWNLMHDMKREGLQIAAEVSEMFSDNMQDIAASVGPPVLEDVLKFCHSAHRWTHAEENNVAVLLTNSKSEVEEYAAMLCCAYMLYVGWERSVLGAWLARREKLQDLQVTAIDLLLNPELLDEPSKIPLSQPCLAYLSYLEHLILCGDPPEGIPLHIQRVVLHGIPRVGDKDGCCRPVLTVRSAKTGKVQFSSLWDTEKNKHVSEPLTQDSLSAMFIVDRPFQGDVILRLHNVSAKAAEVVKSGAMLDEEEGWELLVSFSFHTSMAWTHAWASSPSSTRHAKKLDSKAGLLRLPKETLGIDAEDARFDRDFEVDMVVQEFKMPGGGGVGPGVLSATSSVDTVDEAILEAAGSEKELLQHSSSSEALSRLILDIPARGGASQVPPSPARPTIRVTPNPKELLGEDQDSDVNVNSVPVRFSFPPVDDPFDAEGKNKTLVVPHAAAGDTSELLPLDDAETWALPISGLAMVLPSLVVLEPYNRDANAKAIGHKRARIRIPIENISSCTLHPYKPSWSSPKRTSSAIISRASCEASLAASPASDHLPPSADDLADLPSPARPQPQGAEGGDGGEKTELLEGRGSAEQRRRALQQHSQSLSELSLSARGSSELADVADRVRQGGDLSREATVVLRLEWDCGDAVGMRRVVVSDSVQRQHVRGMCEQINDNRQVLEERIKQIPSKADMQADRQALESSYVEEERNKIEAEYPLQLSPPPSPEVALDLEMAAALRKHLPHRVFACSTWALLYGTTHHGISLGTFFRRTGWRAPTLVVVKDTNYAVFGAFCSAPWEAHMSYFGTGECFVWKWDSTKADKKLRLFRWSQENNMFQLARNGEGIAVGGGSNNALRLDPDFHNGSSGPSETFRSPQLASTPNFKCLSFEVWGFTD